MPDHLRIVIPGDDPPQMQGSPHLERLEAHGEVVLYTDRPETAEDKIKRARGAAVMINSRGLVKWPGDVLRALPELRMIATCSIGVDSFDLVAARECGIVISNQPGRTAPVVAEHAFGLMFALAKRAAYFTASMKAGQWPRLDAYYLRGKTLGVIGTGPIGSEMAKLAGSVGMDVIAWTYNPSDVRASEIGVSYVELDELLRRSDVVSLHVMLTDDSRHMINRESLASMKPGALLINCGRGGLVDTDALVETLRSGRLGGAALDVFEEEPLPAGSPLLEMEHVVLTPHCADMTPEGVELLNEGAVNNVIAFLEGRPQNVVKM
ncbi:MAG: phosphoglycerate dehydrogenase [Gemmatimonadetes bacterium]|nr:phosphoglycerate dehydrogenase [Gemmatimonadota bacterium]